MQTLNLKFIQRVQVWILKKLDFFSFAFGILKNLRNPDYGIFFSYLIITLMNSFDDVT